MAGTRIFESSDINIILLPKLSLDSSRFKAQRVSRVCTPARIHCLTQINFLRNNPSLSYLVVCMANRLNPIPLGVDQKRSVIRSMIRTDSRLAVVNAAVF